MEKVLSLAQSSWSSLLSLYSVFSDSEGTSESSLADVAHPPGSPSFRPCFGQSAVGDLNKAVGLVRYCQIVLASDVAVVGSVEDLC